MCDEPCQNSAGPESQISRSINQYNIITSSDCWLRSVVTLLTLLSFYAHTKNEHIRLRIGNAQNRAVMGSVNSVYNKRLSTYDWESSGMTLASMCKL